MDDNKVFRVNYYGGHQLPRPSLSWPIHHKEIFSAISAIRAHEPMFVGKHITIVTDNCSLQNLKTMQNASGRLQRWTSYLGNFDITYRHIPGHRNVLPDAISRMFEDGSDEMRMNFTPSAATDCADYILNVYADDCERNHRTYEFVILDEHTDVSAANSCIIADNASHVSASSSCPIIGERVVSPIVCVNTVINESVDSACNSINDNTTGTNAVTTTATGRNRSQSPNFRANEIVSDLNPNAEPFEQKLAKNETLNSENEFDEEFYDCVDANLDFWPNTTNVLTRNQTRLAVQQQNVYSGQVSTDQPATLTETSHDYTHEGPQQQANADSGIDDSSDQGSPADAETMHEESPTASDSQVDLDGFDLHIAPHDYRCDEEFADMYHFKVTGELPTDDRAARQVMLTHDLYTVDETDQRLYRVTIPRAKRERTVKPLQLQVCLPRVYRFYVADTLHRTLCHPSTERLYLTLKERYYCHDLFDLARSICNTCSDCQKSKRDYAHVNAPLHPHPVYGFMEQWHIDHLNLCRPTPSGHKYLLVCVDAYSGWPEVYPVFTTSSVETAKCLVDLIARYGVMKRVVTDRGTAHTGRIFREIARMLGVHHKLISSLNPQSDGMVEKRVGLIKANLKLVCDRDEQIIDKLPLVLLGMRGTVSSVTKVSAYHAIYGRPMPLPVPGCDPSAPRQPSERLRVAEKAYLDKVRAQLDDLETRVKQNIKEEKAEVKQAYDRRFRTQPVNFKVGDMVWLKDRGVKAHSPSVITRKQWTGPYFVTGSTPGKEGEGVAYFLTHSATTKRLKHSIPAHRLRLCMTDRTDLLAKYPNLDLQNANTHSPSSQVNKGNDHVTTTEQADSSMNTSDKTVKPAGRQPRMAEPTVYSEAKNITRQRFAPDGIEFLVKFKDNSMEWVNQSQVSPALKADYLIKKNRKSKIRV